MNILKTLRSIFKTNSRPKKLNKTFKNQIYAKKAKQLSKKNFAPFWTYRLLMVIDIFPLYYFSTFKIAFNEQLRTISFLMNLHMLSFNLLSASQLAVNSHFKYAYLIMCAEIATNINNLAMFTFFWAELTFFFLMLKNTFFVLYKSCNSWIYIELGRIHTLLEYVASDSSICFAKHIFDILHLDHPASV